MAQAQNIRFSESSLLKIRCPWCFCTFKAFPIEFKEAMPDFQCKKCSKIFWIDPQEQSDILLGKAPSLQKKSWSLYSPGDSTDWSDYTKTCPRCAEEAGISDSECSHCGLVFIKVLEQEEGGRTFPLNSLWLKVLKNWKQASMHESFFRACCQNDELAWGISCYGRILKRNKYNKKARQMLKQMKKLTLSFEEDPLRLSFKVFLLKLSLLKQKLTKKQQKFRPVVKKTHGLFLKFYHSKCSPVIYRLKPYLFLLKSIKTQHKLKLVIRRLKQVFKNLT